MLRPVKGPRIAGKAEAGSALAHFRVPGLGQNPGFAEEGIFSHVSVTGMPAVLEQLLPKTGYLNRIILVHRSDYNLH